MDPYLNAGGKGFPRDSERKASYPPASRRTEDPANTQGTAVTQGGRTVGRRLFIVNFVYLSREEGSYCK